MPPKAAPKGKKLPTWAYIAAAGIGLVVALLFLRGKSSSSDSTSVPVTTQTPDTSSALNDAINALLAAASAAHPNAEDTGDGTGGTTTTGSGNVGILPAGTPCNPGLHIPAGCSIPKGNPDGTPFACNRCASGTCVKSGGHTATCT